MAPYRGARAALEQPKTKSNSRRLLLGKYKMPKTLIHGWSVFCDCKLKRTFYEQRGKPSCQCAVEDKGPEQAVLMTRKEYRSLRRTILKLERELRLEIKDRNEKGYGCNNCCVGG